MVLSHNDLNVTTVASNGGSIGEGAVGAIAPPRRVRVVSEEFFGNQFSQFVVIFLLQGLRNSSPITNLITPGLLMIVSAQFALTNQPTMTLILVSYTLCEADHTNIT